MKSIFIPLLISTLSFSMTIEDAIDKSLDNHNVLKSINHNIESMKYQILKSDNLMDPDVSFTSNSLSSTEPMKYNSVNIKQKLPWFGKLNANKEYVTTQKNILINNYNVTKIDMAFEIYNIFYSIHEYKEKINLLKEFKNLNIQNENLYNLYAGADNSSHEKNMDSKITLSNINIKLEQYNNILHSLTAKFHYLTQIDINTIDYIDNMKIETVNIEQYLTNIDNNKKLKELVEKEALASKYIDIKELNLKPDPYVKFGYYNRNNFDNYNAVTIGFSLPIYGTQDSELQSARALELSSNAKTIDYKNQVKQNIQIEYGNLMQHYNIYNILSTDSLPHISHNIQLAQSKIENGGNLMQYIDLLNKKLLIEEKIVTNKYNYKKSKMKLQALIGEI